MIRFKRISSRLLAFILPVNVIALVVVMVVCGYYSTLTLTTEIEDKMTATMNAYDQQIMKEMQKVELATKGVATSFGLSYKDGMDLSGVQAAMKQSILDSDLITAMGYFLEPGVYENDPNVYDYECESDGTVAAADLGEMEYTEIDWYMHVKDTGENYYTETYVDTTIGILMTSFVVPIYDVEGNYIGALNTDVDMSAVQKIVEEIEFGESGEAILISTAGTYLTNQDPAKILNVNIADDPDSGFDQVAEEINANKTGMTKMVRGGEAYRVFYSEIPNYDWILVMDITRDELGDPIDVLISKIFIVVIIAIIACAIMIFFQAKSISKPIIKIKDMAEKMAKGDFSIEPIKQKGRDEVGVMTASLNEMLNANKVEIRSISDNSHTVGSNCQVLQEAVEELEESFSKINHAIQAISGAMMDNSATTEELTASIAEVKESVEDLAGKAGQSEIMSKEIMLRAQKIEKDSSASFSNAMDLSTQYEQKLTKSIENSKIVNNIETMAVAISDIAEQINLLSLNASIEAARAGEHGKGFAVVATEIGALANQTSNTVTDIQNTVGKVKESVETLSEDSRRLITFITENVTPDYKSFVGTSQQYEADARSIQELASYLAEIAAQLKETMENANEAIQSIANASQDAADESTVILENVEQVSQQVENVGTISKEQKRVSDDLDVVVQNYKLD